jgi:hypothetical protein
MGSIAAKIVGVGKFIHDVVLGDRPPPGDSDERLAIREIRSLSGLSSFYCFFDAMRGTC